MNKKGFDSSQLFIYIVSIFVVALVFFVGFQVISVLMESSTKIQEISFIKDLEKMAQTVSRNYREVQTLKVSLPDGIRRLCVLDLDVVGTSVLSRQEIVDVGDSVAKYADVYRLSSLETAQKNLFFYDDQNQVISSSYVEGLSLEQPTPGFASALCSKSHRFEMRLEGKSRKAEVSFVR